MNVWYSRPVFFVESVERSIAFYTDKLGFAEASRCEEGGKSSSVRSTAMTATSSSTVSNPKRPGAAARSSRSTKGRFKC
jgi:catechol 2,3-dioxygenase-like lactoylglutathione lyase family enzyme